MVENNGKPLLKFMIWGVYHPYFWKHSHVSTPLEFKIWTSKVGGLCIRNPWKVAFAAVRSLALAPLAGRKSWREGFVGGGFPAIEVVQKKNITTSGITAITDIYLGKL